MCTEDKWSWSFLIFEKKVASRDLVDILRIQKEKIEATQIGDTIRQIDENHKWVFHAISQEQQLRQILEKNNTETTIY